jgi:hypothetical protein
VGICTIVLIATVLVYRIPLGPNYNVADKRTMLGIANALDVLSNVPFFIVGVGGLTWLLAGSSQTAFLEERERIPYLVFLQGLD